MSADNIPASAPSPPTQSQGASSTSQNPPPKSQKQMTKAERREMQEKQRATKAQAQAKGNAASSSKTGAKSHTKDSGGSQPATSKPNGKQNDTGPSHNSLKALEQAVVPPRSEPVSSGLRIFSHFGQPREMSPSSMINVHPAIISLGLQYSSFKITGANARCIAMLIAFKSVIRDYTTPTNTTLSRHLMTHLTHQINYLAASRPLSVTMSNAIRHLKVEVSNSDIDLPEEEAKDRLCLKIDNYLENRIILAGKTIENNASENIHDGDVILTYAKSSVVEKILLHAHSRGTAFSVIVADSRPLLEGQNLLRVLSDVGIPCTYLLISALGSVLAQVSTVILGAHSIHANGGVLSRAGTALVAMMAKESSIPVLVCCETYKISETVLLDSFGRNELAPSSLAGLNDELNTSEATSLPMQVVNPLYDLTPSGSITSLVTEMGTFPSSVNSLPLTVERQ